MVKIRYSELPSGLHVVPEREGRDTIVYLLPGLTPAQRNAALVRVRSSARVGYGPELPAADMAVAVAADRLRTTVRSGAAAVRAHPMLLIPPLFVLVAAAAAFLLLSFVTGTIQPPAGATGSSQIHAPAVVKVSSASHRRQPGAHGLAGQLATTNGRGAGATPVRHAVTIRDLTRRRHRARVAVLMRDHLSRTLPHG